MRYTRVIKTQNFELHEIIKLANNNKKRLKDRTEQRYKNEILKVAKSICKNNYKLVYVAGPSSSGKTTTSNMITKKLQGFGKSSIVVSMDNFFINREDTPILADGLRDYDNITSVNLELFKKCMKELIDTGYSKLPIYDFIAGKRMDNVCEISIDDDTIIIVEGLHALNPLCSIEGAHNKILKIFIAPQSGFIRKKEKVANITPEILRLTRRSIRDFYHRGYTFKATVEMWKNVRAKEDQFIIPFKDEADYIIDTTFMYEPLLYEKEILTISQKDADILELMNYYLFNSTFTKKDISKDSLIWEFLSA